MKKWILSLVVLIVLACGVFWVVADKDMRRLVLNLPTNADVLFWSVDQRDAVFRAMDRLPFLAKARVIEAGNNPYPLPKGQPLALGMDVDAFMENQRASALLIIQDGKVRFERYGLDFGPEGRWTSFSVAKSVTSTLVGAAIKDGHIRSLEDKVSDYIPDLQGSAYDNVTIRQLLTMTSGVRWNEDYADPQSDVAMFNKHEPAPGMDATVSYMRQLPAEAEPGLKWVYKTGETNLIGVLVSSATGKNLSEYLSEKIWEPFGMEQDASWILGATGQEISGCCMQASARDFARIGLFMLNGGIVDGESILPDGWIEEATTNQVGVARPEYGYGYQWWTLEDGAYLARGIFGQGIFIDPERQLIITSNGNWPYASAQQGADQEEKRLAFYRQVQLAVDNERAR